MERRRPPNQGLWSPPGGKVAPGESPLACARRELAEETALTPASLQLTTIVAEDDSVTGEAWLMFVFRCEVTGTPEQMEGPEGRLRLFPIGRLSDLPRPPADMLILETVLGFQGEVQYLELIFQGGRLVQSRRVD